jgi:Fic family protein
MDAQRRYTQSHPWLTFELDMKTAPPRLWIALGEAQSKCNHIAGVPLQPAIAKEMHCVYLARGLLATTAIEGNTLTENEVRGLLDKKLRLPPSRRYLAREIDNILKACNQILKDIETGRALPVSTSLIKRFNAMVLNQLQLAQEVIPGEIRTHFVGVGGYRGAPPEDCEYLLDRLSTWLNTAFRPTESDRVIYGLIKSIVAHLYLAWIHPFGDGNGRTARLLEVKFLMEAGVPSAAAHLLSNHYNLTRTEYYRQLAQSSRTGNLMPFLQYAVSGYVDQLREQIERIKRQHFAVCWINYVHEMLGKQKTPAERRQRDVVLAMSTLDDPTGYVKPSDITKLNADIAAQYATKTRKTLTRDLNNLKRRGLVEAHNGAYRANLNAILAFLPTSLDRSKIDLRTDNHFEDDAPSTTQQQQLPLAAAATTQSA